MVFNVLMQCGLERIHILGGTLTLKREAMFLQNLGLFFLTTWWYNSEYCTLQYLLYCMPLRSSIL
jgi:hypothetical protein